MITYCENIRKMQTLSEREIYFLLCIWKKTRKSRKLRNAKGGEREREREREREIKRDKEKEGTSFFSRMVLQEVGKAFYSLHIHCHE